MNEKSEGMKRATAELEAAKEASRLADLDGTPAEREAARERLREAYREVGRQYDLSMPAHVKAGWEQDNKNRWGR